MLQKLNKKTRKILKSMLILRKNTKKQSTIENGS